MTNERIIEMLNTLSNENIKELEIEYKNEMPRAHFINSGNYTKNFLRWVSDKKIFKPRYIQATINILPCLVSQCCTGDNRSGDVREIIDEFIKKYFKRLLEIKCKVNKPKIMSINLAIDTVEILDAFAELGFCCSRSEVVRFILFHEFLRGVQD